MDSHAICNPGLSVRRTDSNCKIFKRDQLDTIAGYPILIQMSIFFLKHNINLETKMFKQVLFGGDLRRVYKLQYRIQV